MKILLISSAFPPHVFGGGEVAAYNMACLLANNGHQVSVLTMKEPEEDPVWGELQPEGFRLFRVKVPRKYTVFKRTDETSGLQKIIWHLQDYFDFRNRLILRKVINAVKPDQIDVHNILGFGFNSLKEAKTVNIPVKFFLHGLDLACFRASMFKNSRNCEKQCRPCSLIGKMRQVNLSAAGKVAFIAPSLAPVNRMLPFVPMLQSSPVAIIKNVSDKLPALPKWQPSSVTRMVFAGRLDPVKGIEFLLDVLSELSNEYALHIDVLGTGPLESTLREKYGHYQWVTFHGFVSRAEVAKAIAQADLFCMPSLWSEIYGIVTAQALQLGTPVIGSNVGGTVYLVRDNVTGILVPPGGKQEWKQALVSLLNDPQKLLHLRENTLKFCEEFGDASIAKEYDNFAQTL